MEQETYIFHGQERDDGTMYITSPDLRGFRLVLTKDDDIESEITDALVAFYPHYKAAKARAEASAFQPRLSMRRQRSSANEFDISAQFSFA